MLTITDVSSGKQATAHARIHKHTYTHKYGTTATGKKLRYTSIGRTVGWLGVFVWVLVCIFPITSIEKKKTNKSSTRKMKERKNKIVPKIDATVVLWFDFYGVCMLAHRIYFSNWKIQIYNFVFFYCCCCCFFVSPFFDCVYYSFSMVGKKVHALFSVCIT